MKDKIMQPFLAISKDKFTVDTIEMLKTRREFRIGDVVELNGYYSAGDGANHKRKIEQSDDGSGVQLANGLWANIVHNGEVNVSWFGAKKNYQTDDYFNYNCFQNALLFAENKNLKVYIPAGSYKILYPLFIGSGTEVFGDGDRTVINFINPRYFIGRGGFALGSSHELNKEKALKEKKNATYGGTQNTTYVGPKLKQFIRDNPDFIECENSIIRDIKINAVFNNGRDTWGGYGIQFLNCNNCKAYNITGNGWTQLIGMGSDVEPETPSNNNCHAFNLKVETPDLVRTYYAIGFIANSTNCSITNSTQLKGVTEGSQDGSCLATNVCEDCKVENITAEVGLSVVSEGFLDNNSLKTEVTNLNFTKCKTPLSIYASLNPAHTSSATVANVNSNDGTIKIFTRGNVFRNIFFKDNGTIQFRTNSQNNAMYNIENCTLDHQYEGSYTTNILHPVFDDEINIQKYKIEGYNNGMIMIRRADGKIILLAELNEKIGFIENVTIYCTLGGVASTNDTILSMYIMEKIKGANNNNFKQNYNIIYEETKNLGSPQSDTGKTVVFDSKSNISNLAKTTKKYIYIELSGGSTSTYLTNVKIKTQGGFIC